MSKKNANSVEELLKEALVPEEEQPYKVPENWVWVKLGVLAQVIRGVSFKKYEEEMVPTNENCLIVRGGNIQEGSIVKQADNIYVVLSLVKEQQFLKKGDVVIVSSTGSSKVIGKPAIVREDVFRASFGAFLTTLRPKDKLNSTFFGQYFLSSMYRQIIASEAKGSNINNIKQQHLTNLKFPLPPLNEQKRIADKVERLLDKINQAKRLIEEAKETFELRRAAILDKAFRGELTKKWREENPFIETAWDMVMREHAIRLLDPKHIKAEYMQYDKDQVVLKNNLLPESWITAPVGFLCDCIVPGRDKPKSFTGDIPWVTIPDITSNSIGESNNGIYLTVEEITQVKAKIIPKDSVIMSCVGRFGISSVVERPIVINQQLHAFLPSSMILPKYLMYHIKILGNYMESISTSTTISYLNKKNANSLTINLPPLGEQKRIIELIDSLIDKEETALNIIANRVNFEELTQTILSKAFLGELETGNESDENALQMLIDILTPAK